MQSLIKQEYEPIINLYEWVIELYASDTIALNEETKLGLRKACVELASYPYELQIALAKLYKKYYLQLEAPNWSGMNLDKACELDWLKVSLLQSPEAFKNKLSPFILKAYEELLEDDVLVSNAMLQVLAESNQYFLQKFAVLLLKKSLLESGNDFEQAREVIDLLFKSEFDSIIIGAIEVLGDFPAIFRRFPERLFWMVSERDETVIISLLRILWNWGDHSLIQRLLEGDSWGKPVKREAIKVISFFPSEKYLAQLMGLLKSHPKALGIELTKTLKSLRMTGVLLGQNDIEGILSFYTEYDVLEPIDAAFLIQNVSERTLGGFYSKNRNSIPIYRMVALLTELENAASAKMLVQMYEEADLNWEKSLLLNAFIKRGASEFEAAILYRFDENPVDSIEALAYLGGKATALHLRKKLGLNEQKVNLYAWEEKAVKLIFQIEGFDTDLLAVLAHWNVPYLGSIASDVQPTVDGRLNELFEKDTYPKSHEEVQNLQKMVVSIGDQQGITVLVKYLYHEVESVRGMASRNLDKLLSKLYDQKRLTPRALLMGSCADAIRAGRSRFIVDELLQTEHDSNQQDFLLDYLLVNLDAAVLQKNFDALVERGNIHFEKRLIEAVGITGSSDLATLLNKYFDKEQDIFRLRQAIISAEKLEAHWLSNKIEPFLMHRNMNIRKATASFISKNGDIRSVPILIEILKTQDNPGLRHIVEAGLNRILNQRYQTYLLNELKGCKSERQILLLQEALQERFQLPSEKSFELSKIPEFKALIADGSKTEKKGKPVGKTVNWALLNESISLLDGLVLHRSKSKKDVLLETIKTLRVSEKSVIFNHIRRCLKKGKKHEPFLIDLILKNDGILNEDLAALAKATNSESLMEESHQSALLSKVDFSSTPTKIYVNLFRFYNNSHRSTLCAWADKQGMSIWNMIRNEYEDWEFMELCKDYLEQPELSVGVGDVLEWVGTYRGEFVSLLLLNNDSKDQVELMACLSEQELHTHYEFIKDVYLKMELSSRVEFLAAIGKGASKLRLMRESQKHQEVTFDKSDLHALTLRDFQLVKERLLKLLEGDKDQLIKNAEKINSDFWFLRNDERIVSKTFSQLFGKAVFESGEFREIRQHILRLEEEVVWRILEPSLSKGNLGCLAYLRSHAGCNSRFLNLFQAQNEQGRIELLKWLDSISNDRFYFPTLLNELVRAEQGDLFFEIALRLIFKLEACDKNLTDRVYSHVQRLVQRSDESGQGLVFRAMEKYGSANFLGEEARREFILEYSKSDFVKERAFLCILSSINWYYNPDLRYVLDTLKKPFFQANTNFVEQVLLQLNGVNANQRILVFSMLLQVKVFESQIHKSVLDLFKTDYQIVESLKEEQRIRFLEECKLNIAKNKWAEDLAVSIFKNLGLAQLEGYIQLATELVLDHKSRKVRSLCLRELKKGATKEQYLDACENVLKLGDRALQSQVIKALAFAKRARIVPFLIPLLFEKNSSTRKLAKNGILQIGPGALKHLEHGTAKARPDKRLALRQLELEINNGLSDKEP